MAAVVKYRVVASRALPSYIRSVLLPGALGTGRGVFSEVQKLVCRKNIHDRAYLSIGVTSGTQAGLCGVPGKGDSKGIGAGIYKILHLNFGEFVFHALR
jgi:hypothetical protein